MWIDDIDHTLPSLVNFIHPSGVLLSSSMHISRSVCRRAERCLWKLHPIYLKDDDLVTVRYLNRLSDYLFVCARYACLKTDHTEMIYKKKR